MRLDRRALLLSTTLFGLAAATRPAGAQTTATRASVGDAPDPLLLSALPSRARTSLDGTWKHLIDPYDVARRKPRNRRTFWLDEAETLGGPLIEYEWESSPDIAVPGDWNSQIPEMLWYNGPVYYRRLFSSDSTQSGNRVFLVFEAVNYRATIWLNRQEVGSHEGGFTPFVIEVTNTIQAGGNLLVVRADSRHDPETLPSIDFDWQNYGGVTRSVWLVHTPRTFVRDCFLRLEGDQVVADVRLDGAAAANAPVVVRIPELSLVLRGRTDDSGSARLSARTPRRLSLWSPDSPRLYEYEASCEGDVIRDRIGFKRIETRQRRLLLNGQDLFLRGIALHEEAIGPVGTRRIDETAARRLLQTAKDIGCNFVRLAHYPHTDIMSRLCDEMGLLVWAEIPVYWEDVSYASDKTLALARTMMTELVLRDRNRVSVAFWSVANETPQTDARTHFLETVIADVRRLDPTRLVTAALDKNVDIGGVNEGESRISVQDLLGRSLDVIAMNQYEGWYGPRNPGQVFPEVSFGTTYDKPLIMSEFGADALAGHHGAREERWTEEYQAWLYEETLRCIDRDGFNGACPWILKDFRSPRRWHGRFQGLWNRKGVISETGERKLAFDTLRSYYARKAAEN